MVVIKVNLCYSFIMSLSSRFQVDQDNGARWSVYHAPETPEHYLTLTGAGREKLLHSSNAFSTLFRKYTELAHINESNRPEDIRLLLGEGQEAKVYTMGSKFAVRETRGVDTPYRGLSELGRMNYLTSLIEGGTPRWLHTPDHYARLSDPHSNRVYTFMERIDNGITVEDLVNYPDTPRVDAVQHYFGGQLRSERDQDEAIGLARDRALDLFDRAHTIITDLVLSAGKSPDSVLTDWQQRNVLVEPVKTPVAGEQLRLNIIDQ